MHFARDLSGQQDLTAWLHPSQPFGIYSSITALSMSYRNTEVKENMVAALSTAVQTCFT